MNIDKNTRFATVSGDERGIAALLPTGYQVVTSDGEGSVLIAGNDNAGWTLDDYVLPRLASGLYFGHELPTPTPGWLIALAREVVEWHEEVGWPGRALSGGFER